MSKPMPRCKCGSLAVIDDPELKQCDVCWRDKQIAELTRKVQSLEAQYQSEWNINQTICERDINQQKELARLNRKVQSLTSALDLVAGAGHERKEK
jgi:hypothetical protein